MGGNFTTNWKALVEFSFPELSRHRTVTAICHVDDKTKPEETPYDMIIGMDLMTELGIVVDTDKKIVRWETGETPLRIRGELQTKEAAEEESKNYG